MRKFIPLFCALVCIAGCAQQPASDAEQEFNDSGRAKAVEREEDLWPFYTDDDVGISFHYPDSVFLAEDAAEDDIQLSIAAEPIATLEGTMGYNQETALKNQAALAQGEYGDHVDFALTASQEVRPLDTTFAQQFMVLSRFDVCDVTFERKLYFFNQGQQTVLTLKGPKEEIMQSMPEYFTVDNANCGDQTIWNHEKQESFYKTLTQGEGSAVAQEWFDAFDRIADTVVLSSSVDDVRAQLRGQWVASDDPQSSIIFTDAEKIDSYDDVQQQAQSYTLQRTEDGIRLTVGTGEDSEQYAVMELTADTLQLLHLPRGNTLTYQKVRE